MGRKIVEVPLLGALPLPALIVVRLSVKVSLCMELIIRLFLLNPNLQFLQRRVAFASNISFILTSIIPNLTIKSQSEK